MKMEKTKMLSRTYNPQKTQGKPYKVKKAHKIRKDVYGQEEIPEHENKTGDRHPRSVINFHQSDEKLHPTQKPVKMFEFLIKSYSNENNLVCDPFIGSGTTAVACHNTLRRFVGCDINEEYVNLAKSRLKTPKT